MLKILGFILISWAVGREAEPCGLPRLLMREREATLLGAEERKSYVAVSPRTLMQ